jgi:hypothetical protein
LNINCGNGARPGKRKKKKKGVKKEKEKGKGKEKEKRGQKREKGSSPLLALDRSSEVK